jgi:hypothetical protein
MALWGNKDSVYADGTVGVDYSALTVTGTATTFTTAGISAGDVISIGVGYTFGEAVVAAVDSNTQLSIASTSFLSGSVISGATYNISQKPIYTLGDSNYGSAEIYGIDEIEVGVAATTAYAVTHEGWVGVTTYTDAHGNLRVKHEVLVAGGISTTADASDDTFFPES